MYNSNFTVVNYANKNWLLIVFINRNKYISILVTNFTQPKRNITYFSDHQVMCDCCKNLTHCTSANV